MWSSVSRWFSMLMCSKAPHDRWKHCNSCSVFLSHSTFPNHNVFLHFTSLLLSLSNTCPAVSLISHDALFFTYTGTESYNRKVNINALFKSFFVCPCYFLFICSANIFDILPVIWPSWLTALGNTCPQLTHTWAFEERNTQSLNVKYVFVKRFILLYIFKFYEAN